MNPDVAKTVRSAGFTSAPIILGAWSDDEYIVDGFHTEEIDYLAKLYEAQAE